MADIEDNLNVLRLQAVDEVDLHRIQKYHRAWHRLAAFAPHDERSKA